MAKQWTILEALNWTEQRFDRSGEDNPRLAAQMLMAKATDLSRIELYTSFDKPLSEAERTVLRESIQRRLDGEPLQYIVGSVGFRHLELYVKSPVLIPRPETELLVELVLQYASDAASELRVIDIGTGTGALALSLLHEFSACTVCATDINEAAVALAEENAQALDLNDERRLRIIKDNLASSLMDDPHQHGSFDVVVSNPPYIPTAEYRQLPTEIAAYESALALDGGEDGLAVFRELSLQAATLLRSGGLLAVELHEDTLELASEHLATRSFRDVHIHDDLTGRNRFITAIKA